MSWNDHELLVYLLTAMEHSDIKPDYNNAPVPAGRTASGCAQKIMKLKKALRGEMDALKDGSSTSDTKAKGGAARAKGKRGAADDDEEPPKKRGRGRPKKALEQEATPESEGGSEEDEA